MTLISASAACGGSGANGTMRSQSVLEFAYSSMIRCLCVVGLAIVAWVPAHAQGASAAQSDAQSTAAKMIEVLGGRARWAELKGTVNDSQQYRTTAPTEVRAVITMDFQSPRIRIETTGPNLHLIRVIDGARSWRKTRDGKIEAVPKATYDDDMRWYAAHVYRTIHRVARNDPTLELKLGGERLEVWEVGKRLAWYKLNADFEPYAFGAHEDEQGSVSGPWKYAKNGIKHPLWVARPDGTWRSSLNALETEITLTEAMFARPAAAP